MQYLTIETNDNLLGIGRTMSFEEYIEDGWTVHSFQIIPEKYPVKLLVLLEKDD